MHVRPAAQQQDEAAKKEETFVDQAGWTCNNCTNHQESRDFRAGNDQADGIQTVNTSVSTSEDEAESNDEEYMETEVITDDFVYAYDIF